MQSHRARRRGGGGAAAGERDLFLGLEPVLHLRALQRLVGLAELQPRGALRDLSTGPPRSMREQRARAGAGGRGTWVGQRLGADGARPCDGPVRADGH